jgi:hypothetical protein
VINLTLDMNAARGYPFRQEGCPSLSNLPNRVKPCTYSAFRTLLVHLDHRKASRAMNHKALSSASHD